ncbi:MAG: PilT/PilU family type 4a pilus ATPase [Phycisphaerae bacterium]
MHVHVSDIRPLLENMKKFDASDLHLKVGLPPFFRVHGALRKIDADPLDADTIQQLMTSIIPPRKRADFEQHGNLDFSYQLEDGDRFRVCVFRCADQMHAAVRRVTGEIPAFDSLHLPDQYRDLAERTNEGLIIVCGITGAGKSTTIASMIDHVNSMRAVNIVTIEDPVEYRFKPDKAIISQREIGIDIPDYEEGLKFAVRQDPDVIFIGEMRDRQTMLAGIQAAETGHLVFSTLHSADTAQAFSRILEFFEKQDHAFIRNALANSLVAILAQRLLAGADAKTPRVPATEILLNTPTLRDLIRKGRDQEIPALINASADAGMHNMTQSLAKLVLDGMVFHDEAMKHAPNRDALAGLLRGIQSGGGGMVRGHG